MPEDPTSHPLATETVNSRTVAIDHMSTLAMVQAINAEDATVAAAVATTLPQVAQAIDAITARLRQGGRLIYLGAGTSGRLGALDAYECPATFNTAPDQVLACIAGGPFERIAGSDEAEDSAEAGEADLTALHLSTRDAVVGIAASGRTPYVLGALTYAHQQGALTVALVCNPDSPLAHLAAICIAPVVGPEVINGSTRLKAGTAQKMILNMLSTGTMIRLGKTYGNLMVDVQTTNQKLRQRATAIIQHITGLDAADAALALTQADGEVKTAIIATQAATTPAAARARLAAHGGDLRATLETS